MTSWGRNFAATLRTLMEVTMLKTKIRLVRLGGARHLTRAVAEGAEFESDLIQRYDP